MDNKKKRSYLLTAEELKDFLKSRGGLAFLAEFSKERNISLKEAIEHNLDDYKFENNVIDLLDTTATFEEMNDMQIGYVDMDANGNVVWVHCTHEKLEDALLQGDYILFKKTNERFPIYNRRFVHLYSKES